MEVNFFKRRKIFKTTSALELIPVRLLDHKTGDDNKVSIQLPRFRNHLLSKFMEPFNSRKIIPIKLDAFGSATWLLIDGKQNLEQIAEKLQEQFPEELDPPEETSERVSKFVSLLYQQKFITFRQIQKTASGKSQ
jgi:hypothetical protein